MNLYLVSFTIFVTLILQSQKTSQKKFDKMSDNLCTLTDTFMLRRPCLIDSQKTNLIHKIKQFNQLEIIMTMKRIDSCLNTDTMIFVTFENLNASATLANENKKKTLLILQDHKFEDVHHLFDRIKINQEVYFYEFSSGKVFETYTINNIKIQRQLGDFLPKEDGKFAFIWSSDVSHRYAYMNFCFYTLHKVKQLIY